jgi:hypothetical protein
MKTLTIPAGVSIRTTDRTTKAEVRTTAEATVTVPMDKVTLSLTDGSETVIAKFPYKGRSATVKLRSALRASK